MSERLNRLPASETLFAGEKDYAAMYNMICAHSVAQ
jgi:hypothetical protein